MHQVRKGLTGKIPVACQMVQIITMVAHHDLLIVLQGFPIGTE